MNFMTFENYNQSSEVWLRPPYSLKVKTINLVVKVTETNGEQWESKGPIIKGVKNNISIP